MMQMRIVGIQDTIQTIAIVSSAHTSTNVVATKEKKNDYLVFITYRFNGFFV